MGTSSCTNLCGYKKDEDNNKEIYDETKIINNNNLINRNLLLNKSYNNFTQKFESNLPKFGKYYDINNYKQIIPELANNYMIEKVLNIPDNIPINKNTYEMKPIQFKNGNIYSGNWNESYKMDGLGQYYINEGKIFIEGIWYDGNLIYGRIFYSNDNIYEGEIKDSTYNGKGKLIFNNGEIYEGDFVEGEITGKGIFTYSDGTIYDGEIKNGEFKGHGIMKWINGIKYEGDFSGPILSNYGKLIGDNGDKYEGYFYNNYFNGKGIYIFSDGSSYEGEFEFGLKNGKGVYKKKDGFIYDGDWGNNMANGFGKFYYKSFIIKGVWRNGINVEIINFEKGDENNFDKNLLNFEVQSFNLMPHMLPNLERMNNKIDQFGVETIPSYLNTLNE